MKKFSLLLSLILLSSCATEDTLNRELLRIAVPIEAVGLYPYIANDPHSSRAHVLLFDTLVDRDVEGTIIPSIASSWEQVSPTVIDLTINTNIKFHNGDYVTLEDVLFSYEQILATPNLAHTVGAIAKIEVTKDNKFRVTTKEPYAPLLPLLGYDTFKIVNKKSVLASGDNVSQEPVGTGPYKLKMWNRGQDIVLERNEEYHGKLPAIKEVILRTVTDPVARAIALESGDVDMAYDIEGSDRERIMENPNLTFLEREIPRVEYIAMNIGKGKNPLWKDKRGRQAFINAIDQEGIVNSVLFGAGKSANSLLPPTVDGYNKDIPFRKQDIAKSKALLKEIGMESNASVNIWVREGVSQKTGEVLQANLAEVGINATVEIVEYARFLEGIAKGEHDVFVLNWSTITADADYGLNNLLNSEAWGSKGNRSFYANLELDKLLKEARGDLNKESRMATYHKIQEMVYDEVPYIPIYYAVLGVGMRKEIKDFEFDIFAHHNISSVRYE